MNYRRRKNPIVSVLQKSHI